LAPADQGNGRILFLSFSEVYFYSNMKAKTKTKIELKIAITCSQFGNLAKFYRTYAKGNREITVEGVEYAGQPDQHNYGLIEENFTIEAKDKKNIYPELQKYVENFLDKSGLHGEAFSIFLEGSKKELFTEDDF
jgi:hypothetical protein